MDGRGYSYSYPYYFSPPLYSDTPHYANSLNQNATNEAIHQTVTQMQVSTASSSQRAQDETPKTKRAKKTYDKWTNEEQKLLVNLWAERHGEIESKESRKVWDAIASEINKKFDIQRATEKYKKKMSYLVDRYKIAKDWNKKQSGGHRRESPLYKEIDEVLGCRDIVTLGYVADLEAGATAIASTSSSGNVSDSNSDGEDLFKTKEDRTERKKSKKRKKADDKDEEERQMMKSTFDGLKEQNKTMNAFMENFTKMQEQQSQTMNALVGALTGFLKNQDSGK